MKRLLLLGCCAAATVFCGCGPMQMPMPVRLDDKAQKKIDESWDKALTPLDRFDHAAMLDAFLLSHAYQLGVDKLTFHSEKKVAAGTVVMDIQYERLGGQDRFEVKIYDPAQKLLRQETYYREEVESAYQDLFVRCAVLEQVERDGHATPEQQKELAALKARMDAVAAVFPEDKKPDAKEEDKKP
jgi:hypothetical protein